MTASATVVNEPVTATRRDWLGFGVVLGATFMGQVDGFIVSLASPTIQRDLPASFDEVQLVGAGYVLACAAGLVTGGRLGDRFGRRRIFLLGIAVFTLASLACGLAPNAPALIVARVVQGCAAAALVPQELAILHVLFRDDTQRTRALGGYGTALGLGVICGLAGGGLLVDLDLGGLGWRPAFLLNVPIGLLILALGRSTIPESRAAGATRLDLAGAALTMVAFPAILLPLIFGPRRGWLGWTAVCLPVAVLALAVLVRQQRVLAARGGEPLFSPRVLAARGMPASLATLVTFFAGNAGLFLVFTYYVQTGLGTDPLVGGLMLVPLGVGFSIGSPLSGRLVARFGPRLPVYGCLALAVILLGQAAIAAGPTSLQRVLLALAMGGVGLAQGVVVAPLIGAILRRVTTDDAGAASGTASTLTQFGLAAGYAAVGSWYGLVLGGAPGTADAPADLDSHTRAFAAATVLLAALALATAALCGLRDRAANFPGTNQLPGTTTPRDG
ncbi:MFS transporter [Frankia sp. AgPm24]|uniref:MFS transporter n=1 Tax=Frankia sp. AgPm24 TaxID=631128 RepID=UPI00200BAD7A|nr:MFS transporter [Frankia sp. AgPm24]MCK9923359.1 MFS transporter [Frankia sp. AgPm24]